MKKERPEKYAEVLRRRRESMDPEENRARVKKWREENLERDRKSSREYARKNAEKNRARVQKWRRDNPEKHKANSIAYQAKRRARKMKNGGDHDAAAALMKKWRSQKTFLCTYCRKRFPTSRLHVDHIVPVSKGGLHDPSNLCKACDTCNVAKGAKDSYTS